MQANSVFQPRYLKADALNGQTHLVHIERVHTRDDVLDPQSQSEVTRHILYLLNSPKGFMLNKTQTQAVIDATGQDDTDNWIGGSLLITPVINHVGMPTIEISRFDPASDSSQFAQFATRPAPRMTTSADVMAMRGTPRYTPAEPPAHVGNQPIMPPPAAKTRRQSAQLPAA